MFIKNVYAFIYVFIKNVYAFIYVYKTCSCVCKPNISTQYVLKSALVSSCFSFFKRRFYHEINDVSRYSLSSNEIKAVSTR
jgi:hypothetical protein